MSALSCWTTRGSLPLGSFFDQRGDGRTADRQLTVGHSRGLLHRHVRGKDMGKSGRVDGQEALGVRTN
jgi:hypothetical protein